MNIYVDYTPTEKQYLFHESDADEVLYGGAAGGGKSKAVVMDAFSRCMQHPGTHAYLFRQTYPELRDSLIKEALQSIPTVLRKWSSSTHDMRLVNGSALHFRYCRNMQDARLYQGTEIHWLYIDELTHFEMEEYDYLKTRLRAVKSLGVTPRVRCTANPGGKGHGWVKAYFVDKPPYLKHETEIYSSTLNETQVKTVQFIPALVTDNPHMSANYIFELEKKPPALRKALLNGDWSVFAGQVFMEYTDDPEHYLDRKWTHVIEPFNVPKHWPKWRSFDFGYSRPFSVGWWAVDYDGRAYRINELYGWDGITPNEGCRWTAQQIANKIKEIEKEYRYENVTGLADPAIFDESGGESIAEQMERCGVYHEPADHTRMAGKMQFHWRFAFDEQGYPMVYIFSYCKAFIRTVPALSYDPKKVEDVDTDCEDHVYDESRYFFMRHPIAPRENHMVRRGFDPLAITREADNIFLSK